MILVFCVTCQTLHCIFLAIIMYLCNMSDSGQPERVKSGGVSGTCVTKTISSGVWSPDHFSRPTCSFSRPRTIYHNDGNKHTAKSAKCWEHLSKTRKKLLVSNVMIEQKKDSIPSLNSSFCVNSSGPQSANKTELPWRRVESIIKVKWKQSVYDPDPPPSRTWSKSNPPYLIFHQPSKL